ncbi:EF-hand domain-containing protein [Pycnococcus provasolii]
MGCGASTATSTARKEELWPTTVLTVKPTRQDVDDGKTQAEYSSESPVSRAVSLAWLAEFVKAHAGTTHSWEVNKEFMAEEDGGGKDTSLIVTSDNIEMHRDKRRAAEKLMSGKPVPVQYREIPFEQMYTTDIVECFVRSLARKEHMSYAQAENLPVGAPTYFISHAWGSTFVDLVESVKGALAGAAQNDTCGLTFSPSTRTIRVAYLQPGKSSTTAARSLVR